MKKRGHESVINVQDMNIADKPITKGEVELMTRTIPAFLPNVSPRGAGAESTVSGKFSTIDQEYLQ